MGAAHRGCGASLGAFITSKWAVEFEAWIPDRNRNPRHGDVRTLLFSGSAVRFFDDERRGPYLLVGLTARLVEFGFVKKQPPRYAGGVQLGAGSAIRLGELAMVPPPGSGECHRRGSLYSFVRTSAFLYTFP